MIKVLTFLGGLFAFGLALISIAANFWFGTLLTTGEERWLYGAVFALLDSLKTVLIPIAALAFVAGLIAKARIAVATFLLLSALSFTAEIGLYATTKSETVGDAKTARERYHQARAAKVKADAALSAIGETRPVGTIEGELAALKRDRKYDRSIQCTDATTTDSRQLCAQIDVLAGELKTAHEAYGLRREAAVAALALDKQDIAAAMRRIDPQAEALTRLLGVLIVVDPETVRTGLAVLIALLVEVGSGLGPWLATPSTKRKREGAEVIEPIVANGANGAARYMSRNRIAAPDNSRVAGWAASALVKRRGAFVPAKEAREAFDAWCATENAKPLNATAFGKAMTTLGYQRVKKGGAIRYEGIALTVARPAPLRLAVNNGARKQSPPGNTSSRSSAQYSAPDCPGIAPSRQ